MKEGAGFITLVILLARNILYFVGKLDEINIRLGPAGCYLIFPLCQGVCFRAFSSALVPSWKRDCRGRGGRKEEEPLLLLKAKEVYR